MKSIIVTLLASAGLALAADTSATIDTSSVGEYSGTSFGDVTLKVTTTEDATSGLQYTTISAMEDSAILSHSGLGQVEFSISFELNLSSLMTAYANGDIASNTELLRLDFDTTIEGESAGDTGLYLTYDSETGTVGLAFLYGYPEDQVYSSGSSSAVDSITLFTQDEEGNYSVSDAVHTYTHNGETYLALTYVQHSSDQELMGGYGDGSTVTDTEGAILSDSALASWNNNALTSVTLLSEYTTTATIYTGDMPDSGATDAAKTVAGIPEPTTATLSLLALAGLAARRRRK